jgi:hypothetical protein
MVGFHESPTDRKAKARPPRRSRERTTEKFLEYALEFLFRNSPATIENPNLQLAGI